MSHPFRTPIGEQTFARKYAHEQCETWPALADTLVEDVCRNMLPQDVKDDIKEAIRYFEFLPGGRYLRNAGRSLKAFSNCYSLRAEDDTREDWADLSKRVEMCLGSGGGIGVDYSVYRARGSYLKRTGGVASGPVSKMKITNEQGRELMQGGDRRSAIYGSLNWLHGDADELLHVKDWDKIPVPGTNLTVADLKRLDFNWPAPLDFTNVSLNYDDQWLNLPDRAAHPTFVDNVRQALSRGEPGFSFNFGKKSRETLRNACCEFTSEDDSDSCNLGSINMAVIDSPERFAAVTELAAMFLICGTVTGHTPYERVRQIRSWNQRIGIGLMGVHEWLLQRGHRYEVVPELHHWLKLWRDSSTYAANSTADRLDLNRPKGIRAIAPTGTIGMIAGTTTGIEPIYAVAYKRRYLTGGTVWKHQYVVDSMAKNLIERGIAPDKIESAADLAQDFERRIKFQADVQDYVDMAISSTINLPAWNGDESFVTRFAEVVSKYAPRLRGLTCYPDGSRGGQPLTSVPYEEARNIEGLEFEENDSCKGGICGI